MDGVLRCSRYAFGPNRLHYCGPDANQEILAYINEGATDPGLAALMRGFATMFPYLATIAAANGVRDPFDDRVVEAYWIGNELLENVGKQRLHRHLAENLQMKKKLDARSFELVEDKIAKGAMPHHSFHVLDIWKRTGHLPIAHTLESMEECRISWGKVLEVDGPNIMIETEPLLLISGKLALGEPAKRQVRRSLEARSDIEQIQPGELVSVHWGVPCEVISEAQAAQLRKYTLQHIALANKTI
ncbi:MAG: DUF6390 family protein [Patescibacteria group bacterium]|jgi:hypothetical protein